MSGKNKAAASRIPVSFRETSKIISAALLLTVTVNTAGAITSGVTFSATVPENNNSGGGDPGTGDGGGPTTGNGCQIVLAQNSILGVSSDFQELSSKQPGGVTGAVDIIKTGTANLTVSVDAPGSFTSNPLGGDTGVTIATSYQASGATTSPVVDGSVQTSVNEGTTRLDIDLTATRPDPFPAGDYETTATVRCE